jgi:hypothetical protein
VWPATLGETVYNSPVILDIKPYKFFRVHLAHVFPILLDSVNLTKKALWADKKDVWLENIIRFMDDR